MNKMAALFMAAVLLITAACQRKDLLDPHNHYNLIINASFDEHATEQLSSLKSTYSRGVEPGSTSYVLYEKNTQKVVYKGKFNGLNGGLYVKEGVYDLLVYTSDFNPDVDANRYLGLESKHTAETYTRQSPLDEVAPRTDVTEMYMVEPDPTFSILREDIVVLNGYEDQIVDVELIQKSFKYYLTIKAKGLHNIHTAKMEISGMYTSAFLASDEHRANEAGIQTLELDINLFDYDDPLGNGELYGEFWAFGPHQRESILNTITLYFINGDVIKMKLKDLTGQIKKLTKGGEIIVEELLDIKGPAGGFVPSVGDWDDPTDVEIQI